MNAWRGCSSSITISNQCYHPPCELEESSGDEHEGIRNFAGSRTLFLSPLNPVETVGFLKGNTCYRTWTLCNILVWPHRVQMMSPGLTLLKPSWRTLDFGSALLSSTGLSISISRTFFFFIPFHSKDQTAPFARLWNSQKAPTFLIRDLKQHPVACRQVHTVGFYRRLCFTDFRHAALS